MQRFSQNPSDPDFVQSPYALYSAMHAAGELVWWDQYDMPCAVSQAAVQAFMRDRRFGREIPAEEAQPILPHLKPFYAVEAHSMLELEPPRHTRLRGLVLRAFTSRVIAGMAPDIAALAHQLIDDMPDDGAFDLLQSFCQPIPVIVIARLLGVPTDMAPQLLSWSSAMVTMYQAGRSRAHEEAASAAATEFSDFLTTYLAARRSTPADDLLTHLIAAEADGEKLSTPELISTCILLLNAGHEATVHALGNGIRTLLETGHRPTPDTTDALCEEILRYDPPLHMFQRIAYAPVSKFGHAFKPGDRVALLLGAAGRDARVWNAPDRFDPNRPSQAHSAFGGGLHFCVGAPLARLEMATALPILFDRLPGLHLAEPPQIADRYHFNGLTRLMVTR